MEGRWGIRQIGSVKELYIKPIYRKIIPISGTVLEIVPIKQKSGRREMKRLVLIVVGTALLGGCETVGNVAQSVADTARGNESTSQQDGSGGSVAHLSQCEKNYSESGSFFKGKQFRTFSTLSASQPAAYKKAKIVLAKEGWHIVREDASIGLISMSQKVSFSEGDKSVPISVIIDKNSDGVTQVLMTTSITGGLLAFGTKQHFCDFIDKLST